MGKLVSDILKGNLFKGDKVVWMIWFLLCMISLVEVYSASSRMTFDSATHWGPMLSQAFFLTVGLGVILVIHSIPCKWFMLFPVFLLPLAFILLVITVFGGGGGELNGTNRWMNIAGISFQPSEVAKAALIMSSAVVLAKTQAEQRKIVRGKEKIVVGAIKGKRYRAFAIVGTMSAIICGLIFADNVSTAAMLFLVIVVMMFVAHVPLDLMAKGAAVLFGIVFVIGLIAMALPEETVKELPGMKRVVTVKHRILRTTDSGDLDEEAMAKKQEEYDKFLEGVHKTCEPGSAEEAKAIADYKHKQEIRDLLGDKNSQTTYAKIAVANSNVIGLGPGNSIQRDFLQHAESDFIYAIVVEELGFVGAFAVMMLYITLLIRAGRIAQKCRRFFPAYLVLGFGLMMVLQALVNMGVAVGAFPVTGQTLPLISKGGTSILITSFYIGVILSVSRYATVQAPTKMPEENKLEGETLEYATDGTMV